MNHCIEFKPLDIWFLKEDEQFNERKLTFGLCPVCQKPIAELVQFSLSQKDYVLIRKIGKSASDLVESFKNKILTASSKINKMKFEPVTYKWVYGVNKDSKKGVKQYAKDFFGNTVLVKQL